MSRILKETEKPKDVDSFNRLFEGSRTIVPEKSTSRIGSSDVKNDQGTTSSKVMSGEQTHTKRESEFADMIASVPDKEITSSNENGAEANWYTCDWFRGKTSISCETREDCVSQDEYFDTWYNNVARGVYKPIDKKGWFQPVKAETRQRTDSSILGDVTGV